MYAIHFFPLALVTAMVPQRKAVAKLLIFSLVYSKVLNKH